jgi:eukaryotic-like serine/threonine-protein kinase
MGEGFGPYRLRRRIAFGGLAEVFAAERIADTGSAVNASPPGDFVADVVAVKRLLPRMAATAEVAALFVAEGELLVRGLLPHPHVVRGHATGTADGTPYIEMEYVPGADLRILVDAAGPAPLPPGVTARIVLDVCAALDHVHDGGHVVHGDINPSNVLLRSDGVAKLCDFGVATEIKLTDSQPGTRRPVRGTPAYMSPEQVKGERIAASTDIFALGVVLWELLAGARLFHRGPSYLTLAAVVEAAPPSLGDAELDALLAPALAKDPAVRYPDTAALGGALASLASRRRWSLDRAAVAAVVHEPSRAVPSG